VEDRDDVVGGAVPVGVEVAGARIEEHVPGAVHGIRALGRREHLRVEGTAERVDGEVVEAGVVDERRGVRS